MGKIVARHPIITFVFVVAVCGCQSVRTAATAPTAAQDVSVLRKQRKAEFVERFESKRAAAQLAAARSRLQVGDITGCADAARSVLERDPDNAEARALIDDLKAASGPDAETAAVAQASFEDRPPDRAEPRAPPAPTATTIPTHAEADDVVGRAEMSKDSGRQDWLDEASTALDVADVSAARHCLQRALAAEPENRQIAVSASVLVLRYNQPDLALELAQSALPRCEDCAALYRIAGLAHYRRGDFESSQLALRQALSLDNGHPLTYFLLGHTMQKLGDTDAAERYFVRSRRANATAAAP